MGILDALEALSDMLDDDEEFDPSFVLVNETGYDFHEVYVAESDNDNWEEDILGDSILSSGERLNINFTTESRKRYWDLRIVDEDGDEFIFEHFDLARVTKVTVSLDDDGEGQAEYEFAN